MKITKRELKELLREQVKTVVDETKFYDLAKELPPEHSKTPYAPEEGDRDEEIEALMARILDPESSETPEDLIRAYLGTTSAEEGDIRHHADQDDWPPDPVGRDEPDPEEPEALRLTNPEKEPGGGRAFVDRVARRFRGDPPPEERKYGHVYWDEEEGRNKVHLQREGRIKESDLKDMIRATLEEVMDEVRTLPEKVPQESRPQSSTAKWREEHGAFSRKEKERKEAKAKKKAQAGLEEEKKDDDLEYPKDEENE